MNAFGLGYLSAEIAGAGDEIVESIDRLGWGQDQLEKQIAERDRLVEELYARGTLLPEYDWDDPKFNAEVEAITADWFVRHPETIRGSGEFQKKYPEKKVAMDMLDKLTAKGRMTPEEYLILYREIFNF